MTEREQPNPDKAIERKYVDSLSQLEGPLLFESGIAERYHEYMISFSGKLLDGLRVVLATYIDEFKDVMNNNTRKEISLREADIEEAEEWHQFIRRSAEAPLLVQRYIDKSTDYMYYSLCRYSVDSAWAKPLVDTVEAVAVKRSDGSVYPYYDSEENQYMNENCMLNSDQAEMVAELGDTYPLEGYSPGYLIDAEDL